MSTTVLQFVLVCMMSIACIGLDVDDETDAKELHERIVTIDTHCDTPLVIINGGVDVGKRNRFLGSRVDFLQMKEGGLDAIFFAAYTMQRGRTAENVEQAYRRANLMIDKTGELCQKYSDLAELATEAADVYRLEKLGKRAIYLGMENGFPLGIDVQRVQQFYQKGVRSITLCHFRNNDIYDFSTGPAGPEHGGLSAFGKEVVCEMNRLGMLIDVSHISDESFFNVLACSKAPVFASHFSVRAIAHHPRNMSDEMIRALVQNGGVIQICLLDDYVKDPDTITVRYQEKNKLRTIYSRWDQLTEQEQKELSRWWRSLDEKYLKELPTVADLVDHVDHVKNLVGIDNVGIGSDFDGGGRLADCRDVSEFPKIIGEMLRRGYSEVEIVKVWGGNFLRMLTAVWAMTNQD